jgi:hypothetical protein
VFGGGTGPVRESGVGPVSGSAGRRGDGLGVGEPVAGEVVVGSPTVDDGVPVDDRGPTSVGVDSVGPGDDGDWFAGPFVFGVDGGGAAGP